MKVIKKRQVTEAYVEDVLCNKCGQSCMTDCGVECGTLYASWGYNSHKDGCCEEVHLCESCYDGIVATLKISPTDFRDSLNE